VLYKKISLDNAESKPILYYGVYFLRWCNALKNKRAEIGFAEATKEDLEKELLRNSFRK